MSALRNYAPLGECIVREAFVETGLCRGETLWEACKHDFRRLHSIELVRAYVERSLTLFIDDPRVTLHCGSSPEVIAELDPGMATTFFLDAHYSGGSDGAGVDPTYGQCPLLAELAAIRALPWMVAPVVVIDDCHMLDRPWGRRLRRHFDIRQWPTRKQVEGLLSGYRFHRQEQVLYALPGGIQV